MGPFNILAVVDANGNVVERYEYDAWGKVLSMTDANGNALARSAIGNRILWQAREYSWTTGLYYFRNRWYDPVVGRWISKDPMGIDGGINLYEFCRDNPLNLRDPSGNIAPWVGAALTGGVIGGVVGGINSWANDECVVKGIAAGFLGGAVTGGTFGKITSLGLVGTSTGSAWAASSAVGVSQGLAWGAATGAMGGAVSGVTSELGNKLSGRPVSLKNVGKSAISGAIGGAFGGGVSGLVGDALNQPGLFGLEGTLNFVTTAWSELIKVIKDTKW